MQTADEFSEVSENLAAVEDTGPPARAAMAQWLITRRRIEQAHEERELSRALADFEDYIV